MNFIFIRKNRFINSIFFHNLIPININIFIIPNYTSLHLRSIIIIY